MSYTVKRKDHPLRKILPEDTVVFDIYHQEGQLIHTITLKGNQLRKKGLGKDVTNKALNGLFGIQKEGCDGIITSARFILYPEFQFKKTFCIEFFGNDMSQAGLVIADISKAFFKTFPPKGPSLMALEHFDEEYIKAIKYKTKTSVGTRLIAVLLVDMVSNDKDQLQTGVKMLETILEPFDKTGLSIAKDRRQAQRFWQDRKRLGAIAAHTNAFKLNEDIVLPIKSLAEFARFIDQYNIEEKKFNQTRIIQNIVQYLDTAIPLSDPELLRKRVGQAKDLAYRTRKKLEIASRDALEASIHSKIFYRQVIDNLHGYTLVIENVTKVYKKTKARLIVIATHIHAGDGNVHVNIPVLSNDRQMMERANHTADKIMEKAVSLNGVVSGEHGIGITKFKHLDPERINEFTDYKKRVDPKGLMNPNKLFEPDIIEKVFTPSFNFLELEARILNHSSLSKLAMDIANCVRCGRCKPQCPVFFPGQNMFFHPTTTNKNQAFILEPEGDIFSTVFYFPGCGSERVFSKISMASIFLLLKNHKRVVLPPPYMCCGYPFLVNAKREEYDRMALENIIILTQIRDMFRDLTFDACIVSCGTCMESLNDINVTKIFDCPIQDISEYVLKVSGVRLGNCMNKRIR